MKKLILAGLLLFVATTAFAVTTGDKWKFEGPVTITGEIQGATPFILEGATEDAFETSIVVTDPTADNTITLPDASGTVAFTAGAGSYQSVEAVTTTAEALLVAADCGKTILFNHASTGIDLFLPAPVSGCYFKTIVFVAFSDDHTINTNGGDNIMVGHINEIANTSTGVSDADADILTLIDTADTVGDYCEFISDGTSWYFTCTVGVDGGMTTGTT
jgi:hypothetical protein